jgi:hypothetical protein
MTLFNFAYLKFLFNENIFKKLTENIGGILVKGDMKIKNNSGVSI